MKRQVSMFNNNWNPNAKFAADRQRETAAKDNSKYKLKEN